MPSSVAKDLRLELEQIIDARLKSLLVILEERLEDAVARGDVLQDQRPQVVSVSSMASVASMERVASRERSRPSSREFTSASESSKKSLTSSGYQPLTSPEDENQPIQTLSARSKHSARDLAYTHLNTEEMEELEDMDDEGFKFKLRVLNMFTMVMLFIGAIGDIYEVDYFATHGSHNFPPWYKKAQFSLWFAFVLELFARICLNGRKFFSCVIGGWNWFQVVLVSTNTVERLCVAQVKKIGLPEHEVRLIFRFISTIRIARVLKVLDQLDATAELHMLLCSLHGSLSSLGWAAVFILIPTYVFGLGLTQLVSEFLMVDAVDEEKHADLIHYFGTLDRSMMSLFWCIAGGLSWSDAMMPLKHFEFSWTAAVLVVYISAMLFAVLNVLTGVFVTSATSAANMERDKKVMATLHKIFMHVDTDGSGNLSRHEFHGLLKHQDIGTCLQALSFRPEHADLLFDLIDEDKSGFVNIEEFLDSCDRLQGSLKAIDFAHYMSEFRQLRTDVKMVMEQLAWNNSLAGQLSGELLAVPTGTSSKPSVNVMDSYKSKLR